LFILKNHCRESEGNDWVETNDGNLAEGKRERRSTGDKKRRVDGSGDGRNRDEYPSAAVRFKKEERFSEGREVEGLTCD
jgi:hypothetical protein